MPVYNGADFVAEAIRSVQAQTFTDWELVIADNASTDATLSICKEFAARDSRIRVYENDRNLGFAPNFNRVFLLSHGQYFSWISHDDAVGPEFVERCLAILESDSQTVLAFPRIAYVNECGKLLREQQALDLSVLGPTVSTRVGQLMKFEMQGTDIFWCHYGLIRRNVLEETQLQESYGGSDQTLILELAIRGQLRQFSAETFYRREHPGAATMRRGWTVLERAKFIDSADTRTFVFPYCRMLKEHLSAIQRSDSSTTEKLRCHVAIFRRFFSQWKYFANELIHSSMQGLRARLGGTRSSEKLGY